MLRIASAVAYSRDKIPCNCAQTATGKLILVTLDFAVGGFLNYKYKWRLLKLNLLKMKLFISALPLLKLIS